MSLSCECNVEDAAWYYVAADDFSILTTKRSRKCCSCGKKIIPGDEVVRFSRTCEPRSEIEAKIYGDDWEAVSLAPWFMCETCGGLHFAVSDLNLCYRLGENLATAIREHQEAQQYYREQRAKQGTAPVGQEHIKETKP